MIIKLTQRAINDLTLPAGKRDVIYFDDNLHGFGVRLREGGGRMYVVQYKIGAQQRRVTIGSTALLKLEQARATAVEVLAKVKLGGDPAGEKAEAQARAGETFVAVARRYLLRQKARLRPRSYVSTERYLLIYSQPLHNLAVARIDRRTIAARLSEIATGTGPATADCARAALSAFFSWAMKEGLTESNPVIGTNTHRTIKNRDRVLSEAELVEVWRAAGSDAYGTIIKLLICTGQRRNEIGSLMWREADFDARLIKLPAARVKNHRAHDVPLTEPAMELLQAMPRGQDAFIFGTSSIGFCAYNDSKIALDQRIAAARQAAGLEPMQPWVVHDVRRSCATHMAEIGIQPHIIEAVLNHVSGHKAGVAGVYNKAAYEKEKRVALAMWAEHIMALVEGRERRAQVVVPMRA
jgi:integrase